MAELRGRRLALDAGGRPRTDTAGRLVYVDVTAAEAKRLEKGQGKKTGDVIPEEDLDPENTQPVPPPDA